MATATSMPRSGASKTSRVSQPTGGGLRPALLLSRVTMIDIAPDFVRRGHRIGSYSRRAVIAPLQPYRGDAASSAIGPRTYQLGIPVRGHGQEADPSGEPLSHSSKWKQRAPFQSFGHRPPYRESRHWALGRAQLFHSPRLLRHDRRAILWRDGRCNFGLRRFARCACGGRRLGRRTGIRHAVDPVGRNRFGGNRTIG
jgi:hypothetical protein